MKLHYTYWGALFLCKQDWGALFLHTQKRAAGRASIAHRDARSVPDLPLHRAVELLYVEVLVRLQLGAVAPGLSAACLANRPPPAIL